MSILINRPDNPRRPVDWRWQRAVELADNGSRLIRGRDDQHVRGASKFRRMMSRCATDGEQLAALDAYPAMYEAYSLYNASDEPTEHKWELEARLLAREPLDRISQKTGVTREAIELYEKVFFDVFDRLTAPGLVTHTVIGRAVQKGLAERDYDCLWKLFGYWAGPAVLDAYIYKFNAPQHAEGPEGVRPFMRDLAKDQIDMKAVVAVMTMPVNWQTQVEVLNLWARMLEMEANAGQGGAGSETYTMNVEALTQSFEWLKYRPGVDAAMEGKVAELEATGVRVRATELAMIGMGDTPTGLEHLISTAQYPERSDEENTAETHEEK